MVSLGTWEHVRLWERSSEVRMALAGDGEPTLSCELGAVAQSQPSPF